MFYINLSISEINVKPKKYKPPFDETNNMTWANIKTLITTM